MNEYHWKYNPDFDYTFGGEFNAAEAAWIEAMCRLSGSGDRRSKHPLEEDMAGLLRDDPSWFSPDEWDEIVAHGDDGKSKRAGINRAARNPDWWVYIGKPEGYLSFNEVSHSRKN
jgi:hypothetical protein